MRFERRGFGGRRFGGGGRRFFGERDQQPKPVKVGEEYDVEISEVGSRGDGIARIKNFVVFINGAKQGEKTHIKITEVRNRFAVGEKTEASAESGEEEAVEEEATEEKSESDEEAGDEEPSEEEGGDEQAEEEKQ